MAGRLKSGGAERAPGLTPGPAPEDSRHARAAGLPSGQLTQNSPTEADENPQA